MRLGSRKPGECRRSPTNTSDPFAVPAKAPSQTSTPTVRAGSPSASEPSYPAFFPVSSTSSSSSSPLSTRSTVRRSPCDQSRFVDEGTRFQNTSTFHMTTDHPTQTQCHRRRGETATRRRRCTARRSQDQATAVLLSPSIEPRLGLGRRQRDGW